MLKEIIKECILDMINDPIYMFIDVDTNIEVLSYSLQNLGKGKLYQCIVKLESGITRTFFVQEHSVSKKIENRRNKRINGILSKTYQMK